MHASSSTGFQKAWTSLWSCSWGFCGLQILHTQDHNQIGSVPSQKHILALHTSATSAAGVSAGVSAFTYRHKHGTVNNLWIICHFQPTNFTCIPSICTAKYTLKARWFVFALESLEEPEEQNMTTFTVVVFSNHVWKSSQLLPAHVALPMHLPVIFYTGVKVQKYDKVRIPLATKTYLQSSCWSSICGLDGLLFPALVLATNPKTSLNMFTCASLFASFLNMLPRASAAGVSAFTYQSIDFYANTPYGKRKEPFRSLVKNDACMSALR